MDFRGLLGNHWPVWVFSRYELTVKVLYLVNQALFFHFPSSCDVFMFPMSRIPERQNYLLILCWRVSLKTQLLDRATRRSLG